MVFIFYYFLTFKPNNDQDNDQEDIWQIILCYLIRPTAVSCNPRSLHATTMNKWRQILSPSPTPHVSTVVVYKHLQQEHLNGQHYCLILEDKLFYTRLLTS